MCICVTEKRTQKVQIATERMRKENNVFFFSLASRDSKYKYIESNIFTPGDENQKGWKNKCFMYQTQCRREDLDEIAEKQTMRNIGIL